MTNRHCPECHSPVFRYDGREFCPTCQREVTEEGEFADEATGDGSQDAQGTAADAATNGEAGEAAQQDQQPVSETAASTDVAPDAGQQTDGTDPGSADAERPSDSRDDEPEETRPATTGERRPARVDPPARREAPTDRTMEGGDLGEAEAALIREITDLTLRAEETRDLGRERDLFAAAREATETLRELRRI